MDWVNSLADNLAKSKVVVAVFSGDYFSSPWCIHELDLILERSKACSGAGAPVRVLSFRSLCTTASTSPIQLGVSSRPISHVSVLPT
jgi:hypothetical protein